MAICKRCNDDMLEVDTCEGNKFIEFRDGS